VVSATSISRTKNTPAVAAPIPVGPTRIAAAPGAVAPVADPAAEIGVTDITPAEDSAAAVTPAAVAVPETSPAVVAPSEASTAEADTAKSAAAEVSATEVSVPEISATEADSQPEAGRDDQRLAVRGTVDPAEAGADGIVFRIELSRPAEQPVVLIYGTVDGTAKAGKDYEPQQGVVTLTPGSRSADVRVPLIEHPHPRNAGFELFLMADPKVAKVVDQRITATIPAAN
jgi:hypothetical protein